MDSYYSGNTLIATFLFENLNDKEISITFTDFEAKNSEFEKLEFDYNCPGVPMIETIFAGDKLKAPVCFANAEKTPITIYYRKDLSYGVTDNKPITFTVE